MSIIIMSLLQEVNLAWPNSILAVAALIRGRLLILLLSYLPTQQHHPAQCKLTDSE